MDLCEIDSLGYPPSNAPQDGDDDTFLKFVAGIVVQLLWHDHRVDKILASDEENEAITLNAYAKLVSDLHLFSLSPLSLSLSVGFMYVGLYHFKCFDIRRIIIQSL